MPSWLWWLLLGCLIAWLLEWAIDWAYWRARFRQRIAAVEASGKMRERVRATSRAAIAANADPAARPASHVDDGELTRLRAELAAAQQRAQQHQHDIAAMEDSLAQLGVENEQLRARVAELEQAQAAQPPRDRLTKINGIGPVFEHRLFNAGIHTFAHLSAQSPQRLREIVRPNKRQPIHPEQWIAEAARLAQEQKELNA